MIAGFAACSGPALEGQSSSADFDPPQRDDAEDPGDALPVAAVAPAASSSGAALAAEAERQLTAARDTRYDHHTRIDEAAGRFEYDCSGFVGYALSRVAPDALRAVQDATRKRPRASDFEAAMAAGIGPWRRVPRADLLQPGDVIAWIEPAVLAATTTNSGHVMIVVRTPTQGRQPAGQLVVRVVDSTRSGHGRGDRRLQDGSSGLGTGDVVLVVGDDGRAIGYRWSTAKRSPEFHTAVALGRL